MNKLIKRTSLSLVSALILSNIANAETPTKSCYNSTNFDVTWTSYKTLAKVGVGGNFSDKKLNISNKNAQDVKTLLQDAHVSLTLDKLDAHMKLKNDNIATFFTANLAKTEVLATITSVFDKRLELKLTLNGTSKILPMNYTVKDNKIEAKGVIDALDFNMTEALNELNTKVAGHLNKGWNDINIGFTMDISKTCTEN